MKQSISPVVAVIIILVVIGIAAVAWMKFGGSPAGTKAGDQPPGMPPDVAAEFKKRGAEMTGPPKDAGQPPAPVLPGPGGTTPTPPPPPSTP